MGRLLCCVEPPRVRILLFLFLLDLLFIVSTLPPLV
jgi:hypothetical protein